MRGIHPFPNTDAEWRENLRVMTELHERKVLTFDRGAGVGALLGAAAFVYRAAGGLTYTMFPDAATTAWSFSIPVDPSWQRAAIRWTNWYTSPVGAVANFIVTLAAMPWGNVGDNLAALADSIAAARNWPGPAVAEDIKTDVYVNGGAVITTARPWISFRIVRSGAADPNANELWVLGTQVEILPL